MTKPDSNVLDYHVQPKHDRRLRRWWIGRLGGLIATYVGLAIALGMFVFAVWAAFLSRFMFVPPKDVPFVYTAIVFGTIVVVPLAYLVALFVSLRHAFQERKQKTISIGEVASITPASDPDTQSTASHRSSNR